MLTDYGNQANGRDDRLPTGAAGPDPDALRVMDELSLRAVAAVAPLRFTLAVTHEERAAIYALRYRVIVEHGWARPEDLPDGRESDDYDAVAVHVAAWDDGAGSARLAAACRIVFPAPGLLLPTEREFGINYFPSGQVADMSRQIVDRAYRGMEQALFAALLARTWLEIHRRGLVFVGGDFTPAVFRLYRLMGFHVDQVGPAREFWGERRFPIRVDVAQSAPALLQRWGRLMAFHG